MDHRHTQDPHRPQDPRRCQQTRGNLDIDPRYNNRPTDLSGAYPPVLPAHGAYPPAAGPTRGQTTTLRNAAHPMIPAAPVPQQWPIPSRPDPRFLARAGPGSPGGPYAQGRPQGYLLPPPHPGSQLNHWARAQPVPAQQFYLPPSGQRFPLQPNTGYLPQRSARYPVQPNTGYPPHPHTGYRPQPYNYSLPQPNTGYLGRPVGNSYGPPPFGAPPSRSYALQPPPWADNQRTYQTAPAPPQPAHLPEDTAAENEQKNEEEEDDQAPPRDTPFTLNTAANRFEPGRRRHPDFLRRHMEAEGRLGSGNDRRRPALYRPGEKGKRLRHRKKMEQQFGKPEKRRDDEHEDLWDR